MTPEAALSTFLFVALVAFGVGTYGYAKGTRYQRDLYPKLAHGSAAHRLWLKLAIEAILEGQEPPSEHVGEPDPTFDSSERSK